MALALQAKGHGKNASKMFKHLLFIFLDLQVSGDRIKMKAKEKFTIEKWPQTFDRMNRLGLGIRQRL